MSRKHIQIEKPFADRMVELVRALQLIQDSLVHLRAGHVRHLVTLSGQLRALLVDRSAKPLLLTVADILGKNLVVHCMPGVDKSSVPEHLKNGIVLHIAGFPITLHRQYPQQIELSFLGLLKQNILFYKGSLYTAETIIEWYANKAGGAHYATSIPADIMPFLSQSSSESKHLPNVLIQLGQATLETGRQLVKTFVDLEIHAIFVISPQENSNIENQNFLLDAQYEGSPMRLSLFVNKRLMPCFYAQGLQGVGVEVCTDRIIDWSVPRYVHASLYIDEELCTILDISIDGQQMGHVKIQEPLFVLSDSLDYELYLNRAVNGQPQKFSFGLAEMAMYNIQLDSSSTAQIVQDFMSKRLDTNLKFVQYKSHSFGHSVRGSKDIQNSGDVIFRSPKSNGSSE